MPGLFQEYNPFQRAAEANTGMQGQTIKRGSLISFAYPMSMSVRPGMIHDPYPLIVVADIWPRYIRGVNMHYLTFPYMQTTLKLVRANPNFSYSSIRPDRYLADSFRMYNRSGMQQVKIMDMAFLLRVLGSVRRWSEQEIDRVTNDIIAQIRQRTQATADELSQQTQANPAAPPSQNTPQPAAAKAPGMDALSQDFRRASQGGVTPYSFSNQQTNTQSPPTPGAGRAEGQ